MKLSILSLTILVAATTQSIPDEIGRLPGCSVKCLTDSITAAKCIATDYKCQCGSKKSDIETQATPCVQKACSVDDYNQVLEITTEICSLAGLLSSSMPTGSSAAESATPIPSSTETAQETTTQTPSLGSRMNIGGIIGSFALLVAIAL